MDFKNVQTILEAGFSKPVSIKEIQENKSLLPKQNGVYIILNLNKEIKFIEKGTGGYFKGKDPNVKIEILQEKWVNDTNVIYIGKATDLRKRLDQYFRFGEGKNVGHYGGRFILQLENAKNLMVSWKTVEEDSRIAEKEILGLFVSKFNKLPFANLVK